jgi:hypothetical protein
MLANFDRETWRIAYTLTRRHGGDAPGQVAKARKACLAEKNFGGAIACKWVADAITVLIAEKPEDGEYIH